MRKVYVELKVKLVIEMEEGMEVGEVIDDMDYDFNSNSDNAEIVDSTIEDFEVQDSK